MLKLQIERKYLHAKLNQAIDQINQLIIQLIQLHAQLLRLLIKPHLIACLIVQLYAQFHL